MSKSNRDNKPEDSMARAQREVMPQGQNNEEAESTQQTVVQQAAQNEKPRTTKLTAYLDEPTAKEFKHAAIDENMDYSQLMVSLIREYLRQRRQRQQR